MVSRVGLGGQPNVYINELSPSKQGNLENHVISGAAMKANLPLGYSRSLNPASNATAGHVLTV